MLSRTIATLQAQLANAQEEVLAGGAGRAASPLRDARSQVNIRPPGALTRIALLC
jgi:hypothetical protein